MKVSIKLNMNVISKALITAIKFVNTNNIRKFNLGNAMNQQSTTSQQPQNKYASTFYQDWPKATCINPADVDLLCKNMAPNQKLETKLDSIITNSNQFPISFPVDSIRCNELKRNTSMQQLEKNINSTYPLLHEKTLELYVNFLKFKRKYGSDVEKSLYEDMDVVELVNRLLTLRAISFYGFKDTYMLTNRKKGNGQWELIGTDMESPPLTINNVISYDEIKLSALLYVSGYTQFINDGNRMNAGVPATDQNLIQETGIIIGLVGTRLSKKEALEFQEIIVTPQQNTRENGYGPPNKNPPSKKQKWRQLWADFYQEPNNLYETVWKKYKEIHFNNNYMHAKLPNTYFDNCYYKKRLCLPIDTLLFEANERAKEANKMAYIHMVGIGLGVWKDNKKQQKIFIQVFAQRLKVLKNNIRHISDIHFAYFDLRDDNEIQDKYQFADQHHKLGGVRVHVSKREPSSRLTGEHRDKLLIETYAWDGNAQPGNEFWFGSLKSSGDPAAACSTQVAELHNSHINTENVCGNNLRIASREYGMISIFEYAKMLQKN